MKQKYLRLGKTVYRHRSDYFGIYPQDRLRHMYILGKTGTGKSSLLLFMLVQDAYIGSGFALLDPHGSLARDVITRIPAWRLQSTLYMDLSDEEYSLAFNLFREGKSKHSKPALLVSQLISIFKKHWSDFWGVRLEYTLRNALLAITEHDEATFLMLYRFLTDETYREKQVVRLKDPLVKRFWEKEFASYSSKFRAEVLSPVLNKLGSFLASPVMRRIFSQVKNRVPIRNLIDQSFIIIANLSTGAIGEDNARLFGSLLFSSFALEISSRSSPYPPFYVYADEFQYFVTDSIATILSESRKYGLGLVLAHQYLSQLSTGLQSAVLGNVGNKFIFRIGQEDALLLQNAFLPHYGLESLQRIPRYHVLVSLLANGEELEAFLAQTLLLPSSVLSFSSNEERLRELSRKRFCTLSTKVDEQIKNFLS